MFPHVVHMKSMALSKEGRVPNSIQLVASNSSIHVYALAVKHKDEPGRGAPTRIKDAQIDWNSDPPPKTSECS